MADSRTPRQASRLGEISAVLWVACLALVGCGTSAESNGGDSNLPSRGIVPFRVHADERDRRLAVLSDGERALSEPDALRLEEGVALYLTMEGTERTSIGRAEAPGEGLDFGDLVEVLGPEQAWEAGRTSSPAVLDHGGVVYLWYVGGDGEGESPGALGLARSSDGFVFLRETQPVLVPEPGERLAAPDVVRVDGHFVLFVAVTPADSEQSPPRSVVVRFDSTDGLAWDRVGVVLEPGSGCLNADGAEVRCWDGGFVREPGARASRSPAGRPQIDLWYTGGLGGNAGIGFAGSFDGRTFSRYRQNPIIDASGPESGASVVELEGGLNLYYAARQGRDGSAIFVALQR
jgi:hypothetical protein